MAGPSSNIAALTAQRIASRWMCLGKPMTEGGNEHYRAQGLYVTMNLSSSGAVFTGLVGVGYIGEGGDAKGSVTQPQPVVTLSRDSLERAVTGNC